MTARDLIRHLQTCGNLDAEVKLNLDDTYPYPADFFDADAAQDEDMPRVVIHATTDADA